MPVFGSLGRVFSFALAASAAACSAEVGQEHDSPDAGTTRAVIAVNRSAPAASPADARADAFAGFLRTPADADVSTSLRLAGLGLDLPATGACRKTARGDASASSTQLARLELLDAGEVTLAAGGNVTALAPRAFPTITDSISGVVYTTRDRAAAPLPAAATYTIATSGGTSLVALSGEAQAPGLLAGVELDGVPLASADSLSAKRDLVVDWTAGGAGDRVYLELGDGADSRACSFADEAGHGVVPAALVPSGSVPLTVHRLREADFTDPGLTRGAVRFDFELSASVTFE